MHSTNASAVLVFDTRQGSLQEERTCQGLLSTRNFLECESLLPVAFSLSCFHNGLTLVFCVCSRYFVHLIDIESGSAQGEYTRLQIERALELLAMTTLRELLQFFCKCEARFQCVLEDEAYFNIILRFACGMDAVGVLFEYADQLCNFAGSFSVFDMLAWIQQDVSRLSKCVSYSFI